LIVAYERLASELKKEIASISAELSSVADKKVTVRDTESGIAFVEKLLDKCGHIDEMNLEAQRELVKALFKQIIWNSDTEGLKFVFISDNNGDDPYGDNPDDGNDGNDDEGGDLDGEYASLATVIDDGLMSHFHEPYSAVMSKAIRAYLCVTATEEFSSLEWLRAKTRNDAAIAVPVENRLLFAL